MENLVPPSSAPPRPAAFDAGDGVVVYSKGDPSRHCSTCCASLYVEAAGEADALRIGRQGTAKLREFREAYRAARAANSGGAAAAAAANLSLQLSWKEAKAAGLFTVEDSNQPTFTWSSAPPSDAEAAAIVARGEAAAQKPEGRCHICETDGALLLIGSAAGSEYQSGPYNYYVDTVSVSKCTACRCFLTARSSCCTGSDR
jgi:hypothetical protein